MNFKSPPLEDIQGSIMRPRENYILVVKDSSNFCTGCDTEYNNFYIYFDNFIIKEF